MSSQFVPHVELLVAVAHTESAFVRYVISMLAMGEVVLVNMRVGPSMTFVRVKEDDPSVHTERATQDAAVLFRTHGPFPLHVPSVADILAATTLSYGEYVAYPKMLAVVVNLAVLLWCGNQWWRDSAITRELTDAAETISPARGLPVSRRSRQARCVAVVHALRTPGAAPVDPDVMNHVGFLVRHGWITTTADLSCVVLSLPPNATIAACLGKRKQDHETEDKHGADVPESPSLRSKKRPPRVRDAHNTKDGDAHEKHPAVQQPHAEQPHP